MKNHKSSQIFSILLKLSEFQENYNNNFEIAKRQGIFQVLSIIKKNYAQVLHAASIADGATGRQDGYLISSVSENSNSFSAHEYTLDTITPRISYLR